MKLLLLVLFVSTSFSIVTSNDGSNEATITSDSSIVATPSVSATPTPQEGSSESAISETSGWITNLWSNVKNTSQQWFDGAKSLPYSVYNSTSFNLVTDLTSEIYENIEKLLRKVIIEESVIGVAYKVLGKTFGNLADPEQLFSIASDILLSISLSVLCIFLSYAAYTSSVSIFTILSMDGLVYLLHKYYGAKYIFDWLIYICYMIYTPIAWLASYLGFTGTLIVLICLYVIGLVYSILKKTGYVPTTEHRVYTIDTRLARMETQLARMEQAINDMKNCCKKDNDKKPVDDKKKTD